MSETWTATERLAQAISSLVLAIRQATDEGYNGDNLRRALESIGNAEDLLRAARAIIQTRTVA